MSNENEFVANLLTRSGSALAGFAAADMSELRADATSDSWSVAPVAWKTWFEHRVQELAAAVSAGKPQLFEQQVRRAASHFKSRNRSVQVIERAFQSLRSVLETELPPNARPVAERYLTAAAVGLESVDVRADSEASADTEEGRLTASYLIAILEGDRRKAFSVLREAASSGWSLTDLYLKVLAPAQREVGQMWIDDEINIADEHFATTTTKMAISQLYASSETGLANGKTVLAAAVPGNRHDIGLQMIANVFELDGWQAISLGADLPTEDLVHAAEVFRADLLLISAAVSSHLTAVRDSIRALREYEPTSDIKILVGGAAFAGVAELAEQYGADGYAADATDALATGRRLLEL